MKLLVVDDEKQMANAIRDNLEYEGFKAECAYGGRAALDLLQADKYALIILDVMMPDLDGFSVLKKIRENGDTSPVIFLTARSTEADKLQGLELGADDYIVKPFSILEMIARVKAVLNRTTPSACIKQLQLGSDTVDFTKMTLTTQETTKELSRYEADILQLLASEPDRVYTRAEILDSVWGQEAFPSNRTIDNQIVKLRQKIETDPKNPQFLISVYGKGYKLTSL